MLARAALVATLIVALAAPAAAESFKSLKITGPSALAIAADPRLQMAAEGTIELWLAAADPQPTLPDDQAEQGRCLVQHGDARTGIDYRISLTSPTGDGIAIHREAPAAGSERSLPLVGEAYVHVAFVTTGASTEVFVDGRLVGSRDGMGVPDTRTPFGYLPMRPEGRPLILGCDGTVPTAEAWVASLRFWDRALHSDDIMWASGFSGFPEGRPELTRHLLAYSLFTDQRQEMRFTGPAIAFTESAGAPVGEPFFHRRPQGQELASLYILPHEDGQEFGPIADLVLELDGPDRGLGLTDGAEGKALTLPTVLPVRVQPGDLAAAVFYRNTLEKYAARREDPDDFVDEGEVALFRDAFLEARRAARNAALGFTDQDGVENFGGDRGVGRGLYHARRLDVWRGERLRRLAGLHNGRVITALRFESNLRHPPLIKGGQHGSEVFSLELPAAARFEGIAGTMADGALTSLSLAYSRPEHPEQADLPSLAAQTLWVDRNERAPSRILEGAEPAGGPTVGGPSEMRGDYESQRAYRIAYDPSTEVLSIIVVEPFGEALPSEVYHFRHDTGQRWYERDALAQGHRLDGEIFLTPGRIHWVAADKEYERTLVPVAPYPGPHRDKLPWGGTFSLEQRPASIEASFKGYFPYRMRARDFQATTGVDKYVFAIPADDAQDYTTTGSHVIVPHGLYFRRDNKGSEQESTQVFRTAEERQFGWNLSLGVNAKIPLVFSFNEDVDYQTMQESMASTESSTTLTRSLATHYAMVMDLGRMRLHPEFAGRIEEMKERLLTEQARDWPLFFRTFGTHYPYAVTYGGMAWMETSTEIMDLSDTTSEELQEKVEAEGTFEEIFSIGGKLGGGFKSSSTSGGGSTSTISVFGTNGGNFLRGGGWSLGRGEEVPLLLDLRPIHQLLNPAFFNDPLIWGELREEMQREHDAYVKALSDAAAARLDWAGIREDPQPGGG